MRIAMLTSWFYPFPSGSANRFYEIGKRLACRHEIHIYTTSLDRLKEENLEGMRVHRYCRINPSQSLERGVAGLNLAFSLDTMRRMVRDMARWKFDIIDCNMTSKILPFVCFLASKLRGVPLVETWHEVWYTQNLSYYNVFVAPFALVTEYTIPRLATCCIAVSNSTKYRLMKLLRVDGEKIVVIPNGIDLDSFRRISAEKKKARIVYVGRLETHKGLDMLLRAFKGLQTTFPESELIIIGDGSQRRRLVKLSEDLRLTGVRFMGVIPRCDLFRTIGSASVLVLPSLFEGHGVVLLEAMAAGTPPIAVKSPESGVNDVVKHGFNGLLVKPCAEEIEKAVDKLLTNHTLYDRIRESALGFIKHYDWDIIATKVLDFYEYIYQRNNMAG